MHFEADGRFIYLDLPNYWTDQGRTAFLIKVDGAVGGFALVKQVSYADAATPHWDVAEFFIAREHRRNGAGTRAAHALWRRFSGLWQVRVLAANDAALHFWQKAIAEFIGAAPRRSATEREGEPWHTFHFDSRCVVSEP